MSSLEAAAVGGGGQGGSDKMASMKEEIKEEVEDRNSAYFQYYALLSHQAQMLQDSVRTTTYQKAIMAHAQQCFQDKVIMDVGAGNGILSIFAAQAGARKVYAVEASNMVERFQEFVNAANPSAGKEAVNPWLAGKIVAVNSKMEDVTSKAIEGNEKVDTVISECLGVLLVHERMCESFLDARDRFLKPGGAVLPSSGTICLAPIEDKMVWEEAAEKARFWNNKSFHGVDITPFSQAAWEEVFSSPVVGCFGPLVVLTTSNDYQIDFQTISKEDLKTFTIPLSFDMTQTSVVHGLGGWFDLHFLPPSVSVGSDATASDLEMSAVQTTSGGFGNVTGDGNVQLPPDLSNYADFAAFAAATAPNSGLPAGSHIDPTLSATYMTTSPFATPTHWQQVRFLLAEPLAVNKGQRIVGEMHCEVNQFRSYTLTATLQIEGSGDSHTRRSAQWRLDRQVYSWTSAAPAPQ